MSFTIKLGKCSDPHNKINKSPSFPDAKSITGDLRDSCDMLNPIILCKFDDPSSCADFNYLYVEAFKRYYYITGMRILRNRLIEISAHVDVLYTYREDILANKAIIDRTSNASDNGLMLTTPNLWKVRNDPHELTWLFSKKPDVANNYFVLVTASSPSTVTKSDSTESSVDGHEF